MAVTDAWQMGVALPIRNHKFRHGTWKSTTLSADADATASLSTTDTTPNLDLIAKRDDSVIVGPSGDSSYTGKSETGQVSSLTSTSITLKSAMSNNYDSGDSVRVYGTALAGGWTISETGSNQIVVPKSISADTGAFMKGKVDNYAQRIVMDFANGDFATYNQMYGNLQWNFGSNPFLPFYHYRAGMLFKSVGYNTDKSGTVTGGITIKLQDGQRQFVFGTTKDFTNSSWTELTTATNTKDIPSSLQLDTAGNGYVLIYVSSVDNTNVYADLFIDDVYVEHAHGTTAVATLTKSIDLSTQLRTVGGLNVLTAENFEADEKVYLIDEANGIYGEAVIETVLSSNIWQAVSFLGTTMNFYSWDDTNKKYVELDTSSVTLPAGTRVQQANPGVFTFTEYPMQNTIRIDELDTEARIRLADGSFKNFYPMSDADKSKLFQITCRFANVSETFWNKLMVLRDWQRRGNLLNLHPKHNDLPTVMTGYMSINNVVKDHWDLTRRSFDLTFTEAF